MLPTWSSTILQSSVSLSDFGGQVNWNAQVSNHPTFNWTTLTCIQSDISLSNFGGNLDASRVNNITISYNDLLDKPILLRGDQGAPGIDGSPGRDGVDGLPRRDGVDDVGGASGSPGRDGVNGVDGASPWSTIDRPEWTNQITYSNVGSYMLPTTPKIYDLVVGNSATPSAKTNFNLGQKGLRYLNV